MPLTEPSLCARLSRAPGRFRPARYQGGPAFDLEGTGFEALFDGR